MTTIRKPAIPFIMSIPNGPLNAGHIIIIHGEPLYNCNRFSINLVKQANMKCIFHFDARFDQGETVRNSNYPSEWGHEERSYLPFHRGKSFYMEIRCLPDRFMIAVDGNHYCQYVHRASCSLADTLQIQGDVRIDLIQFQNSNSRSSRLNVNNPMIPFTSPLNAKMNIGNEIQVHGRVKSLPNRFHINLQQGTQSSSHPTIALHFNPRFTPAREVVLNSYSGGWGAEQKITGSANPFHANANFMLIIRRQPNYFEMYANGSCISTFSHRISADCVDSIVIDGDVIVDKVALL